MATARRGRSSENAHAHDDHIVVSCPCLFVTILAENAIGLIKVWMQQSAVPSHHKSGRPSTLSGEHCHWAGSGDKESAD